MFSFVAPTGGISLDVAFLDHAQRTDNGQWHLVQLQPHGHRLEAALVEEVHQCGVDKVVLMMTEGQLVETEFLGEVEEFFPAIPRT